MKIVITGGNGYVGRELTRLACEEHEVVVVDNLRYGEVRFTPDELAGFRFENIDIRDSAAIGDLFREVAPDVIIHLAAIHFIPECEQNPAFAISTNIEGTVNLLDHCPPGCRFVFASSGAIYAPQDSAHSETTSPVAPMDVYGFSKLHGEAYVKHFSKERSFPAVVVRLFNVVGPGETNPHLLPEIFAQLQAGQQTIRLGNMKPQRDYIHVLDAAQGFLSAATLGSVDPGESVTVNLGTNRQHSVERIIGLIQELSDFEFEVEQEAARVRRVDRPCLLADNSSIAARFGWKPSRTIEDTIRDLVEEPDLPNSLLAKYSL